MYKFMSYIQNYVEIKIIGEETAKIYQYLSAAPSRYMEIGRVSDRIHFVHAGRRF